MKGKPEKIVFVADKYSNVLFYNFGYDESDGKYNKRNLPNA